MLVLSRKQGQRILIGNDIVLTVTAIEGSKIRLGFDAPAWIKILREEVQLREEATKEEQQ
jgi:carbon storage regulator